MEPCRHSELRMLPTRARPVPFCRQGFLPPPETSPRLLVECVPRRRPARYDFVASQSRLWFGFAAKIASESSSSLTVAPSRFFTSTVAIFFSCLPSTTYSLILPLLLFGGRRLRLNNCRLEVWRLRSAHHHVCSRRAWDGSLNYQCVLLGHYAHHFQVAHRHLINSHVPRGAHTRKHARRKRRRANGTRRAMEHRSVRSAAAAKVMTLVNPRKPFPFGNAGHIHALVHRKLVHQN